MRISDWSSDGCSSDLMQQAVDAPRMHMQWLPDLIAVEPGLLTPDAQAKLEAMGHKIREMKSWGADEAILVDSDGALHGANDRRRPAGLAAGYRSEEHTAELQSLMRNSYAVFCLKKKKQSRPTK